MTEDRNTEVIVVDSIMGSGKTTWAIQHIKEATDENIMYITPLLDEIERIKKSCYPRQIHDPKSIDGRKMNGLAWALQNDLDVASTHALFKQLSDECIELLSQKEYVLFIDEALDTIEEYQLKHKGDIQLLVDKGLVRIREDGFIEWIEQKEYDSSFNEIKTLARNNCLFYLRGKFLMWRFPPRIFKLFKRIYILTYMFSSSLMSGYFKMCGVNFEKKSVIKCGDRYELVDYFVPDKGQFRGLIDIYEGRYTKQYDKMKDNTFSYTWYASSLEKKATVERIKLDFCSYVRYERKAKSADVMWTTFKEKRRLLSAKGYAKGFVSCNSRGTNKYADRSVLIYGINKYMLPALKAYLSSNHAAVDEDLYALAEMLQWIWRSRIRNGEKIWIYIPSPRMRRLLKNWLDGNIAL